MCKMRKEALESFTCLYLDDGPLLVPFIMTRLKKKRKKSGKETDAFLLESTISEVIWNLQMDIPGKQVKRTGLALNERVCAQDKDFRVKGWVVLEIMNMTDTVQTRSWEIHPPEDRIQRTALFRRSLKMTKKRPSKMWQENQDNEVPRVKSRQLRREWSTVLKVEEWQSKSKNNCPLYFLIKIMITDEKG